MILELEKQVCSLELARKLKELGVKQESLFYWTNDSLRGWELRRDGESFENSPWSPCFEDGDLSAFTVAELGKMLPQGITTNGKGTITNLPGSNITMPSIKAKNEADARALILIDLLENNLISLPV